MDLKDNPRATTFIAFEGTWRVGTISFLSTFQNKFRDGAERHSLEMIDVHTEFKNKSQKDFNANTDVANKIIRSAICYALCYLWCFYQRKETVTENTVSCTAP